MPGHTSCLAHLADTDRDAYLGTLGPGADLDHRGTPITGELLNRILDALRDPTTGRPRFGTAWFESATFEGTAQFESVTFEGAVMFESAVFEGVARFQSATFGGTARFHSATFKDTAQFGSVIFHGAAGFQSVTFEGAVGFKSVVFHDDTEFESATFQGMAQFELVTFEGDAEFGRTTFQRAAHFTSATFRNTSWFAWATFADTARFASVTFEGIALFSQAAFESSALFTSATFQLTAGFLSVTFGAAAGFQSVTFESSALFISATVQGDADFRWATFQDEARFESAAIRGDALLDQAVFKRSVSLGPLVCAGRVGLSGVVFSGPVALSLAARRLECRRTRWSSTAEFRLRYATVDFAHAVFEYPLTIATEAEPFVLTDGRPVAEEVLAGEPDAAVRMASLRGVDAAHLVLADVDLSGCLFTGTVHLDQLRLEGTCFFDKVPPRTRWRRWRPIRFTQRRTLAEEHHWRASQPSAVPGWNVAVFGAAQIGPAQLAPVYRALRKAFEDGKNEPGAADFYYGEMEMRRRDRTNTTRAERGLLHAYWGLSGYGLRAVRALGWLAAAMLITIVLLMGFGIPQDSPKQEATGTVPPGGGKVTFEIEKDDPQNPTGNRLTDDRFEKALNVTLNSVVFRASGQDLTTAGTYIEMTSRLLEPSLLALAVLAVRGRIKR
ncbi:pentapeptide repeat-containing protein [Streptomyces sp. AK02-01A]|uniref:pentapeptide repeat-containing protein n=1 Tax=Streptomyces sp. AK02-01A TaxID=3028648 RepID=UPI0029A23798|nr:pentapeptide repeat-containing protein [Streptomyces sp. AK02-01A]MDX3854154.1 pentapeptide repeat-containing protein [Streptomyces sp. AK02-01A]